ncbi:MAG: hypothetical protein QXL94_00795 [Candidatus Parvarchaeum sp.]
MVNGNYNLDINLEKNIEVWARGELFPREYSLSRKIVSNFNEIKNAWNGTDEYLSLFSLREGFYMRFNSMVFDIDGKSGGTLEALEKLKAFREKFKFISRVYFSGVGFHVFTDFKEPIADKIVYKTFARNLVAKYGLETLVDMSCVGDVRRMLRAPTSINSKSNLMAGQVSLEEVFKVPYSNYTYIIEKGEKYPIEEFGVSLTERIPKEHLETKEGRVREWKDVYGQYPPCITTAAKSLDEEGELNHSERIHLAAFLIGIGKEDELIEHLKNATDFNERISEYQVNYIRENSIRSFSCKNASNSICGYVGMKSRCPFYPSINSFVDSLYREG